MSDYLRKAMFVVVWVWWSTPMLMLIAYIFDGREGIDNVIEKQSEWYYGR